VAATERDRRRPVRPAAAVYLLDRLREDKLIVAFVAEFSRGKSELINAVFFAGYGNRILPSSAGRTTMCPTELQWKEGDKPEIRLLPIESRKTNASITELKRYPDPSGRCAPSTPARPEASSRPSPRSARRAWPASPKPKRWASPIDTSGDHGIRRTPTAGSRDSHGATPSSSSRIRCSSRGLVILDTPGLNAIGAEPELTLNLLPNAHAVLFIPGRRHRRHPERSRRVARARQCRRRQRGRIVALNKIDGLWDGLRTDADIEREIAGQVASVASTLEIDPSQVFPVSAQKGLVAKVNDDAELLERSRLADLERRLSTSSCPPSATSSATTPTATWPTSSAAAAAPPRPPQRPARAAGTHRPARQEPERHRIHDAQGALREGRVRGGLQKYYAVRSVFSNLSNNLFGHLGLDALRDETRRTREAMLDAAFSRGCARP
jgi:hypothetical protein